MVSRDLNIIKSWAPFDMSCERFIREIETTNSTVRFMTIKCAFLFNGCSRRPPRTGCNNENSGRKRPCCRVDPWMRRLKLDDNDNTALEVPSLQKTSGLARRTRNYFGWNSSLIAFGLVQRLWVVMRMVGLRKQFVAGGEMLHWTCRLAMYS